MIVIIKNSVVYLIGKDLITIENLLNITVLRIENLKNLFGINFNMSREFISRKFHETGKRGVE